MNNENLAVVAVVAVVAIVVMKALQKVRSPISSENRFDAKQFKDELHDRIHRDIHDNLTSEDPKQQSRRKPLVIGVALHGRGGGGVVMGAILILIGLAFLLDHLGYISIGYLWRFWPLLLVVAGVINLTSRGRRLWGTLLIAGGAVLQLNQLGITHFGWNDFWPMILIAIGLVVMWGSLEWRNKRPGLASGSTEKDPRTALQEAVVFGGLERRISSQDFQGGSVNVVFGGVELDLTEANIQGEEATLEINAIFGGVELRVPTSWQVAYRGSPIFGGIEDKTRTRVFSPNDPETLKPKTLILTGAVVFAGVEIKN